MFPVFLFNYGNTLESLREQQKASETLASTAFLVLLNFHCFRNSLKIHEMFFIS